MFSFKKKTGLVWVETVWNVSIISDVPCSYYTICYMFYLYFIAFSGTNLLTRCLVPVFCCFSFQKSYTGNILGIAWDKKTRQYFPVTYTETEGETEGGCGAPTPPSGASPPRRTGRWCGAHRAPPGSGLRPYIPLHPKTLSTWSNIHEKLRRRRRHQP